MATLTGQTIAGSYKDLLQVSNSNDGVDATARAVSDGEGTASLLYLSTTEVYSPGKAGTSNTVFGKSAGASLDAGSNYNVFIGENVSDASMNDAVGNVGIGYEAMKALTTGDQNIGIGFETLHDLNTGTQNTFMGYQSGDKIVGGSYNVAIGVDAIGVSTDVDLSVAIGHSALGGGNVTSGADK